MTVVSRQPASRRQSDTGFSKLRAAGAQYYCTVVASLSDRRSRSHGAMACAFCVFFSVYHTSSEHRRFDFMFSPVQRASVPSRSFTHASLVRPRGLHHAIVTHSTGHREKLRLCSRARQIGRALGSENEAYFNVCFSTLEKRIGCPTSALLHMLWNLYTSGYDMHTGGSVTYS